MHSNFFYIIFFIPIQWDYLIVVLIWCRITEIILLMSTAFDELDKIRHRVFNTSCIRCRTIELMLLISISRFNRVDKIEFYNC